MEPGVFGTNKNKCASQLGHVRKTRSSRNRISLDSPHPLGAYVYFWLNSLMTKDQGLRRYWLITLCLHSPNVFIPLTSRLRDSTRKERIHLWFPPRHGILWPLSPAAHSQHSRLRDSSTSLELVLVKRAQFHGQPQWEGRLPFSLAQEKIKKVQLPMSQ